MINILAVILISLKQQTPESQARTLLLHIGSPRDPRLKALRESPVLLLLLIIMMTMDLVKRAYHALRSKPKFLIWPN